MLRAAAWAIASAIALVAAWLAWQVWKTCKLMKSVLKPPAEPVTLKSMLAQVNKYLESLV